MLESLFNEPVGLRACNPTKKRLPHSCFPMKIAKFLRIIFFYIRVPAAASEVYHLLFQRSSEQKPVPLSAITTRFS